MTAKDGTNRGGRRKGAGRPKGVTTIWTKEQIDRFRARIQTDKIIQRLNKVALGEVQLLPGDSPQITAGLGLLRKVIPDQAAMEHTGTVELKRATELTDDELANLATGSSAGTAQTKDDTPQLH